MVAELNKELFELMKSTSGLTGVMGPLDEKDSQRAKKMTQQVREVSEKLAKESSLLVAACPSNFGFPRGLIPGNLTPVHRFY